MARIRLSVNVPCMQSRFAAMANIYDLTSDRAGGENQSNLLIPSYPSNREIDLKAGRYLVEIRLPSGTLMRKEVQVQDGAAPQDVLFQLDTPHEWLGLQVLVGNLKGESKTYRDRDLKAGSRVLYSEQEPDSQARVLREEGSDETEALTEKALRPFHLRVRDLPQTWIVSSKLTFAGNYTLDHNYLVARFGVNGSDFKEGYFFLHPELRKTTQYDREGNLVPRVDSFPQQAHNLPIKPVMSDNISHFFEIDSRTVLSYLVGIDRRSTEYESPNFERVYLWTQVPGGPPQYSVLPVPWILVQGEETVVQAYVNVDIAHTVHSKNYDALHRISIAVKDDVMASLLGYLGSGDLPSALIVLKEAERMLMAKLNNPLAAAAGAYVMLEQTELDQHRPWHDWIRNLMNFFKWLPDGAIQYAWLQLAETNAHASDDDIRKSLLEAYHRGLPYYSAGVKLLLNGLTLFAKSAAADGEPDKEIEKALKNVQRLAIRTDRRQPFTSVIAG